MSLSAICPAPGFSISSSSAPRGSEAIILIEPARGPRPNRCRASAAAPFASRDMVEILKGCGPGVFRCGPHGSAAGTYLNLPGGNRRPHHQRSRLVVSARLEIKYCFHSIFGFSPPHSTAFTDDLLALHSPLVAAQPGPRFPAPSRAGGEAPGPERPALAGNSAGVARGLPRLRLAQ